MSNLTQSQKLISQITEQQQKKLMMVDRHAYTIDYLTNQFADKGIEVHVEVDNYSVNFLFNGTKDQFKIGWRILRDAGFKLRYESDRPKPDTLYTTWSGYFDKKDNDEDFSIWIYFSSTQCERVKVGTVTKEVDVYEIRCS